MSEAVEKAWMTRERRKIGERVAEHRRQIMFALKDLLEEWNKVAEGREVCVVCGDGVPKTILQGITLTPLINLKEKSGYVLHATTFSTKLRKQRQ